MIDPADLPDTGSAGADPSSATGVGGAGGDSSTGGAAGGGGSDGGLPAGCPATIPTEPGPCAPDGLICEYGGFCNFVECFDGMWTWPLC